ncbi:MAG: hypothetical protein E7235_06780 [Lachnospiraceae bacterium]|nr:hypothetical protein [Lachnospiraceae bacterium]
MEKRSLTLYDYLRLAAVLLAAIFFVSSIHDVINYPTMLTSMPLYMLILGRAATFLIPCAIVALIAFIVGKKTNRF